VNYIELPVVMFWAQFFLDLPHGKNYDNMIGV